MLVAVRTAVDRFSANATVPKTAQTLTRYAFTTSRCDMGVTVTNTERDGDLCVLTINVTAAGNATTTENVVGHLKQLTVDGAGGVSNPFTLTLEDTANGMQLFSGTVDLADINPTSVNNGSGAYCRGPLKATASTMTIARTINVYYEKM